MKTEGVFKIMEFTFELNAVDEQTKVGFSFELTIADLRVEFKYIGKGSFDPTCTTTAAPLGCCRSRENPVISFT